MRPVRSDKTVGDAGRPTAIVINRTCEPEAGGTIADRTFPTAGSTALSGSTLYNYRCDRCTIDEAND